MRERERESKREMEREIERWRQRVRESEREGGERDTYHLRDNTATPKHCPDWK